MLEDLNRFRLPVIALFGAEDDDDDEGPGGESATDTDIKDDDHISKDYAKKLRRENAKHRTEKNELSKKVEDLEAEIAEARKKELSDIERLTEENQELQTKQQELETNLAAAAQALINEQVRAAVRSAANDAKFADPEDAVTMLDLGDFVDKDGDIDNKAIVKEVEALAEEKKYLLNTSKGSADGSARGGKVDDPKDFDAMVEKYEEQFKAQGRVKV